MSAPRLTSFEAFWPFYLGEHSLPTTRWLHFVGTTLVLPLLAGAAWSMNGWLVLAALVNAYGWAWVSHYGVEKNRPATFTYPLWSFAADWKMWAMMATGRIDAELRRLNITPKALGAQPVPSK